MQENANKLHF